MSEFISDRIAAPLISAEMVCHFTHIRQTLVVETACINLAEVVKATIWKHIRKVKCSFDLQSTIVNSHTCVGFLPHLARVLALLKAPMPLS